MSRDLTILISLRSTMKTKVFVIQCTQDMSAQHGTCCCTLTKKLCQTTLHYLRCHGAHGGLVSSRARLWIILKNSFNDKHIRMKLRGLIPAERRSSEVSATLPEWAEVTKPISDC